MLKAKNIDEYIAAFPADVQKKLSDIRKAVKEAAPEAGEAIKYDMPTFTLSGNIVSFAAFKKHIGFYGVPTDDAIKKELSAFKEGKGSVQFPLDKPMPITLIKKIVKIRIRDQKKSTK